MRIEIPSILAPLFEPYRYKIAYGGRGSGKSWGFARALLVQSLQQSERILCAREFQNSIKESVHRLLCEQIEELDFLPFFKITRDEITCTENGSHFFFYGLRNDPTKIKSTEGITKAWVEEAETITQNSLQILIPTIRKEKSELWFTFNPKEDNDPIYQIVKDPPPNAWIQKVNWRDNPWFPSVLLEELETLKQKDYDLYLHVWEGHTYNRSEAQIFWDKVKIQEFQPLKIWNGPYYGLDWGFANDPMRLVRLWIADNRLWIEKEVNGLRVDINKIPKHLLKDDPFCDRYIIRADNARPETISYCQQHGLPKVVACKKGKGSIDDGITFIRSFDEIIIHPSCRHTIEEARLYSYKVDRLTGDVLPQTVDAYNHSWDAVRYALEPMTPRGRKGGVVVTKKR